MSKSAPFTKFNGASEIACQVRCLLRGTHSCTRALCLCICSAPKASTPPAALAKPTVPMPTTAQHRAHCAPTTPRALETTTRGGYRVRIGNYVWRSALFIRKARALGGVSVLPFRLLLLGLQAVAMSSCCHKIWKTNGSSHPSALLFAGSYNRHPFMIHLCPHAPSHKVHSHP